MGVRWGLVSTAAINHEILVGARASDRVDITTVASRTQERADAYAAANGIPRAHGSYDALLDDPEVDAVYISTPNDSHVPLTVQALEAGKHVLVEKPFSRHAAQVEAACTLAESKGLMLSEAFMWRHNPQTAKLTELVASGAIGRIVTVRASFGFDLEGLRGSADTRFDPALDGGGMMDVGCYCLNGIRLITGAEPERVSAEQIVGPSGVDVAFAATMRMSGVMLGQFECSFITTHRDELEVIGEEGSLFVDDPWHCWEPGIELRRHTGMEHRDGVGVERIAVPVADSYRLQLENLTDAIEGRATLLNGPDEAIKQARAVEALYLAAESGTSVVLS